MCKDHAPLTVDGIWEWGSGDNGSPALPLTGWSTAAADAMESDDLGIASTVPVSSKHTASMVATSSLCSGTMIVCHYGSNDSLKTQRTEIHDKPVERSPFTVTPLAPHL